MSCAVHAPKNSELILIFPRLKKLLLSADPFYGYAILAHEIGHIVKKHAQKNIKPLQTQLEADAFALSLGLGRELSAMLKEEEPSQENKKRLAALNQ